VRRVVLLTDFGTADGYAAAMAGVIAQGTPAAVAEHAAHDVAPGDILGAALALSRYAHYYPAGTVHLVVVDPGVGSDRRPLAASLDGRYFVGPDNGVFSLVLERAGEWEAVAIERVGLGEEAAPTFHGRDIFAPAAAYLAAGGRLSGLGPTVSDPVRLSLPRPRLDAGSATGEVLHVDRFGTLLTNIPGHWIAERAASPLRVRAGEIEVGPVRHTFSDVGSGELVALLGSLGWLEIAVRDGRAADALAMGRGAPVEVRIRSS
jgi:S-adenosyl-L-methionine hydrolase (adenosine-forming)